jgi:hypothetical protein
MDMSAHVIPKSDQMNADDLISGPRTITITKVSGTGNSEQPVAVSFEGDNGKPYKPGKSMRRVMIAAWGPDASKYVGRQMTLYCDPGVVFGGMKVGGIRISHMTDIDRDFTTALTVTKAKRAPFTVKKLTAEAPKVSNRDRMFAAARAAAVKGEEALTAFTAGLQPAALEALKPILAELRATAAKIPAHDDDGVIEDSTPAEDDAERDHLPTDNEVF